jgi:hypothetical protein
MLGKLHLAKLKLTDNVRAFGFGRILPITRRRAMANE